MPDAEGDAGHDRRRLEGIDLVRRHHDRFVETVAIARAQNGIADDPGRAVGRDIDDLDREIRIPRARRALQNRVDAPADLHRLLERLAAVNDHVVAFFPASLAASSPNDEAALAAIATPHARHWPPRFALRPVARPRSGSANPDPH